jgi:3-deoxy-7-phosphoheptulonate synthase
MIVVMQFGATQGQIEAVCKVIRDRGHEPLVLPGEDRLAVGVPDALDPDERATIEGLIARLDGVSKITQTTSPYKLASREFHRVGTLVRLRGVEVGAGVFTVFAGPCSVESLEQFRASAELVRSSGAKVLRGGAFKPRTSPYSFQGLQEEGLRIIRQVGEETGLATVSEVMSADMVGLVAEHVDMLQIGARSMQNFPLLIEAGKSGKPVFLKRGPSATIDEFLLAAEYILNQGNDQVVLCERGVMPLDRGYTRNTLDLAAVPVLKEHTHLPVVVDPSHGTGVARYVAAMAKAAMAAGADGVMVEAHPDPNQAMSDAGQALDPGSFSALMDDLRALAAACGTRL